MIGIIYRYRVERNIPRLDHWTINFSDLPPDTLLTPGLAYQYFKTARKRFRIPGKTFTFYLGGKYFMLGKTGDEFTVFELGDEHGQADLVVGEDGHDPE